MLLLLTRPVWSPLVSFDLKSRETSATSQNEWYDGKDISFIYISCAYKKNKYKQWKISKDDLESNNDPWSATFWSNKAGCVNKQYLIYISWELRLSNVEPK